MALNRYTTCKRCYAYALLNKEGKLPETCPLGYSIEFYSYKDRATSDEIECVPLEPCPKPHLITEFVYAQKHRMKEVKDVHL